jgi:hypothetical protein
MALPRRRESRVVPAHCCVRRKRSARTGCIQRVRATLDLAKELVTVVVHARSNGRRGCVAVQHWNVVPGMFPILNQSRFADLVCCWTGVIVRLWPKTPFGICSVMGTSDLAVPLPRCHVLVEPSCPPRWAATVSFDLDQPAGVRLTQLVPCASQQRFRVYPCAYPAGSQFRPKPIAVVA